MKQTEKIHGFILSSIDYGDNDKIISLFSLEHGRLSLFAKSARRSRKRFSAPFEPIFQIDAEVQLKDDSISKILQSDVISLYPEIIKDLNSLAVALYACELTSKITALSHPYPRLYRLISALFNYLNCNRALIDDKLFFEINILNILGYRPSLENCPSCGNLFDQDGASVISTGEVICRNCSPRNADFISFDALSKLKSSLSTSKFGSILYGQSLSEAEMLLSTAILNHTEGKAIKSAKFIDEIF